MFPAYTGDRDGVPFFTRCRPRAVRAQTREACGCRSFLVTPPPPHPGLPGWRVCSVWGGGWCSLRVPRLGACRQRGDMSAVGGGLLLLCPSGPTAQLTGPASTCAVCHGSEKHIVHIYCLCLRRAFRVPELLGWLT